MILRETIVNISYFWTIWQLINVSEIRNLRVSNYVILPCILPTSRICSPEFVDFNVQTPEKDKKLVTIARNAEYYNYLSPLSTLHVSNFSFTSPHWARLFPQNISICFFFQHYSDINVCRLQTTTNGKCFQSDANGVLISTKSGKELWLFRPFAGSPLAFRPLACLPPGLFNSWLICPLARSPLVLFTPWPLDKRPPDKRPPEMLPPNKRPPDKRPLIYQNIFNKII